ncbi:hypothetical protein PybrP1_009473 [[Pythium] brassicae (nom. inval.)]|nr:hypothetical protein PybrP1_009473 [[Pythium] brassicae (nom. inval.)]
MAPSPPPPRTVSGRVAVASPTAHVPALAASSPNAVNRAKREAFPRSQLWTWRHSSSSSDSAKDDLIESMLRECAPTVPVLTSGPRRMIQKKDSSQQILRSGGPASSTAGRGGSLGPAGEGWRTYKLAHRTNKLIAKTRRAIDVLTKERDGAGGNTTTTTTMTKKKTTKKKHRDSDGNDGDDVADGENSDDDGDDDGDTDPGDASNAVEAADADAGETSAASEHDAAMARFAREVLCEANDEDARLVASSSSSSSQTTREAGEDGAEALDGPAFWNIYKSSVTCKRPDSARGRYIEHCERDSLLVLPVLDLGKPSRYDRATKALRFDNYYFGDQRAEAFGDALQLLPVHVTNLSLKNVGISGGGSSAILGGVALHHLSALNFSENRIGAKGTLKLFTSLRDPHAHLRTLDLGNNHLGDQAVKLLIECLLNRCTLEHLDLRRNQIFHAARAVGELLRITTPLKSLNLSWNNIRGEPAQHLARCMMENLTLTHLDLSDNTLGNNGNADAELGACLATNKSLTHLDVSNNRIHGRSVLIYANGLQQNTVLEALVMRGNPIGSLGTEAILRAVAVGAIPRCQLDIGECNLEIQESNQQALLYGGGIFTLNLAERADAALLRELLLLCWKNKTEIVEALHNGTPFAFSRKDERAFLSVVPSSGTMVLKTQPNYERHEEAISARGFEQVVRLLQRSFGQTKKEDEEASKLCCIRLLAEEFLFTVEQVNVLLALFQSHTSQVEKATAAAALIPQIHHTAAAAAIAIATKEEVYDCASMATPAEFFEDKDKDGKIDVCGDICMVLGLTNLSAIEQSYVEQKVGKWVSFNVHNPTGRYELNMASSIDRRILMRVLEVNKHEKRLRQHWKLQDTSQHGNKAQPLAGNFRNVKLNHRPVAMDAAWQFPRLGVLAFDFVMTRRPYTVCTALSDAAFEQFLKEFKQLGVGAALKLVGLRAISTRYYFTCSQTQRVMEYFGTFERDPRTGTLLRAEVFVILFSRTVDEWNFAESLALLDLGTKTHVLDRVGYLNCFHPMQNNETYEHLRLDAFDQRQLALALVRLAASGEAELSNVVLNTDTAVESDVWRAWTADEKLPAQGRLSLAMRATHEYQTEAQLPAASYRKKLLQSLLLKPESKAHELAAL